MNELAITDDEEPKKTTQKSPTPDEIFRRQMEIQIAGNQSALLLQRLEEIMSALPDKNDIQVSRSNIFKIMERMALLASKENMAAMSERLAKLEAMASERLGSVESTIKEVSKTASQAGLDNSFLREGQATIKDSLRQEIARLEISLRDRKAEAHTQISGLKSDLDKQTEALKGDLKDQTTTLKGEVKSKSDDIGKDIKELRDSINKLGIELAASGGTNAKWLLATTFSVIAASVAIGTLVLRLPERPQVSAPTTQEPQVLPSPQLPASK